MTETISHPPEHTVSATSSSNESLQPLSLRRNVVWIFLGNVGHAACQMGLLVLLAKLGTSAMVGQFALAIAVTGPVFVLTNLGLRSIQATDSRREFQFGEFLATRLLTVCVALCSISVIACAAGYRRETMLVVIVMGAAKVIESFSDVLYGLFQQSERLDWIAKSKFFQGVLSLFGLSAGVYLAGSVAGGVVGILLSWLALLLLYDIPNGLRVLRSIEPLAAESSAGGLKLIRPRWNRSRMWKLFLLGSPIGGTALLSSLNKNIPRYFLAFYLGESQLGIFSVLATLMMAGTTVTRAINNAVCPRVAKLYHAGRIVKLKALLVKLVVLYVVGGVVCVLAVAAVGPSILAAFFKPEYARHANVLVYVMIAASVMYVAGLMHSAMIAVRCVRPLFPLMCFATATSLAACYWLVPTQGLRGAAMALAVSNGPMVVIGMCMLWSVLQRKSEADASISAASLVNSEGSIRCAD